MERLIGIEVSNENKGGFNIPYLVLGGYKFLFIPWSENMSWEDVSNELNIKIHAHIGELVPSHLLPSGGCEQDDFQWPFSITVYSFDSHFIISEVPIADPESILGCIAIPAHELSLIAFVKEYVLPFLKGGK